MNTARTIFSLMLSGTVRRFTSLRFIFSHGGGVMPLLVSRIEGLADLATVGRNRFQSMFPNGVRAEFASLYFEDAQGFDPVNYEAVVKLVPTSHILVGTDWNRLPMAQAAKGLDGLPVSANIKGLSGNKYSASSLRGGVNRVVPVAVKGVALEA